MQEQQKAWAMQWKSASARLQAVRDQELRELDSNRSKNSSSVPLENGLVVFQRWMMRLALLGLDRKHD